MPPEVALEASCFLPTIDHLIGPGHVSAPRDNVILEMGMFIEAKGRDRVLLIREEEAKIPADIGGSIYLSLQDRDDIKPIHTGLLDFIKKRI
jgi:predicted nucleotide-binding protein